MNAQKGSDSNSILLFDDKKQFCDDRQKLFLLTMNAVFVRICTLCSFGKYNVVKLIVNRLNVTDSDTC